ncbi:aminoglycoside phosphotransferase family protein [Streptomyces sp. NPDC018031]|uniref:aminoglycoside phosphotransferase family protein n=1 Tax=Streptomyces sp. NPDC018031 TaxID=3365033 RepID=UPI00379ABE0A
MALARRLVDARFPDWAGLPLRRVEPGGSDHVIFRLGRELSVRLPRHPGAAGQAVKESRWLPRLAPHLPLAVPEPVAVGSPAFGYPWSWAVSRWVDGEPPTVAALGGSARCARDLARFLTALRDCPTRDAPGDCHVTTGLAERDQATRGAIARLAGVFDARAMTGLWEAALRAPAWHRPPVWFHGDFHTGNLLAAGGRLVAVIDFGELGIGDPSRDLTIAFTLMSADARAVFRARLGVDEATWTRGRGWALATGLNAYLHYADTEPRVAAQTTRQIGQALLG